MDARRFDALSRALNASPTRRAALWALASLGLLGASDLLDPDDVEARKKKGKGKGKKKKKSCAKECCPGTKECLGNDVCCDGICLQCCNDGDCPRSETCCPSGNCKRGDEECCGPGGECPSGKHCCSTGICRQCCNDQHCTDVEAGTKCCQVGFCTKPNEQCCHDADCPNPQLPICCETSSGGTACSQCCTDLSNVPCTNSLRPLCCLRENGVSACDQCCVDADCGEGKRCNPLGDCVFCIAIGEVCATDFGCCSDFCEPTAGTHGRCANRPLPGP